MYTVLPELHNPSQRKFIICTQWTLMDRPKKRFYFFYADYTHVPSAGKQVKHHFRFAFVRDSKWPNIEYPEVKLLLFVCPVTKNNHWKTYVKLQFWSFFKNHIIRYENMYVHPGYRFVTNIQATLIGCIHEIYWHLPNLFGFYYIRLYNCLSMKNFYCAKHIRFIYFF